MKKYLLLITYFLSFSLLSAFSQQIIKPIYIIQLEYDENLHAININGAIKFINNSHNPINSIRLSTWMNAYASDSTVYSEQQIAMGNVDWYFQKSTQRSKINQLQFYHENKEVAFSWGNPTRENIVITLPKPVFPRDSIILSIKSNITLPSKFKVVNASQQLIRISEWLPLIISNPNHYTLINRNAISLDSIDYSLTLHYPASYQMLSAFQDQETFSSNNQSLRSVTFKGQKKSDLSFYLIKGITPVEATSLAENNGSPCTLIWKWNNTKDKTTNNPIRDTNSLTQCNHLLMAPSNTVDPLEWENLTYIATPKRNIVLYQKKQLDTVLYAKLFQSLHRSNDGFYQNNSFTPFPYLDTTLLVKYSYDSIHKLQSKLYFKYPLSFSQPIHPLLLHPAIGYNRYDGLQAGILFHNKWPFFSKIDWLFHINYAFQSKKINSIGDIAWYKYVPNSDAHFRIGLKYMQFSIDDFKDNISNTTLTQRLGYFSPSILFTSKSKLPYRWSLGYKLLFLSEDGLNFKQSIINNDTVFVPSIAANQQIIGQLRYTLWNNRYLYPYRLEVQMEHTDKWLRPALETNYFINYRKSGGLQMRAFVGGFIYLNNATSTIADQRFGLSLSNPTGNEDYNYRNYFIGRNEFNGWMSQQQMIRDGGFKIQTPLLSNEIGQSQQWLAAINLSSTIPNSINPLQVLPFTIPLEIYLNIGSSSTTWNNENNEPSVLYEAGLSLFLLKKTVQINLPLVYSKPYREYMKSFVEGNILLQKISFSINIHQLKHSPIVAAFRR